MPDEVRPATDACRNCGSVLHGPFCAECGQNADDYRRPIWALTKEVLESFLSYDERLLRTVRDLFLRPGVVMRAWTDGRRKTYSAPLRLYLTISVVYFFSLALSGQSQIRYAPPASSVTISTPSQQAPAAGSGPVASFIATINRGLVRAQSNPAVFNQTLEIWLKRIPIFMVPVLALLLALFYRRSPEMMIHYIVFALYFHSGALLIFMVSNFAAVVLPQAFDGILLWLMTAVTAFVGAASARTYFRESVLATGFKWFGIAAIYLVVISIATVGVVLALLSNFAS